MNVPGGFASVLRKNFSRKDAKKGVDRRWQVFWSYHRLEATKNMKTWAIKPLCVCVKKAKSTSHD
ncbi:MAG: hypothetical protein WDZ51_00485 [Pirellulaceae bacterium]